MKTLICIDTCTPMFTAAILTRAKIRKQQKHSWTDDWIKMKWCVYIQQSTAKSLQSCLTLYDPIDSSPPGTPVPGILQARTLESVAISFFSAWKWKVKSEAAQSCRLLPIPQTAAYQASLSMGFSRQEYLSGAPLPILFSHKKKDEILPLAITWMMNLEGYCANWSKSEEDKCYILSLIVKPKNKGMNTAIQKKTQRRN